MDEIPRKISLQIDVDLFDNLVYDGNVLLRNTETSIERGRRTDGKKCFEFSWRDCRTSRGRNKGLERDTTVAMVHVSQVNFLRSIFISFLSR